MWTIYSKLSTCHVVIEKQHKRYYRIVFMFFPNIYAYFCLCYPVQIQTNPNKNYNTKVNFIGSAIVKTAQIRFQISFSKSNQTNCIYINFNTTYLFFYISCINPSLLVFMFLMCYVILICRP
jgi:hypothetical protein